LQNKPWLKRLRKGDPPFLADPKEMFYKEVVDGSNGYVPGKDFYDGEGQQEEEEESWEEEEKDKEEFVHNPMSTSGHKSKRLDGSTANTLAIVLKRRSKTKGKAREKT
jgi:hypothetical protein